MTVTTPVCSAVLIGSPDTTLRVNGGSITLDASGAPHVQATLDIAVPALATLSALDPRQTRRVRITSGGRVFNLGLRSRPVSHRDASVTLELASDEALLSDYAPLTDDTGAFAVQSSLRGVINYVLNKAIPGTSLASAPSNDADVTTYATATNVAANPRGSVNTNSWGATGSPALTRLTGDPVFSTAIQAQWGGNSGSQYVEHSGIPVQPGRSHTMTISARSSVNVPSGAYIGMAFLNSAGVQVGGTPQVLIALSGSYNRKSVTAVTPPDASIALARLTLPSVSSGQTLIVSALTVRETAIDPADTGYFDGDTTDTSTYDYSWTGIPGASSTNRRAIINRPPDSLYWKAGTSALDFLAPIVQAAGYRLVCDEARVWTLRSADYTAPGALSIRHAVNLYDATDTISRDSGFWFDAAVTTYTWTDSNGNQQTARDAYALTMPYTRLMRFERDSPFPGAGFSQYVVQRAQGRGREVSATARADWTACAEQPVTIVLNGAPTQIGTTTSVRFDLTGNDMTVTTRTTDTPAGAIDLMAGNIDSLTGSIDSN